MPHLTSNVMFLSAIAILFRNSLAQIPCSSANALPVSEQANGFPNVDPATCHNDPECFNFVKNVSGFFAAHDVDTIGFLNERPTAASPNVTLTCNGTEHCLAYKETLFCINTKTGSYHDQAGGQGNLRDRTYAAGAGSNATISTTTMEAASTVWVTQAATSSANINDAIQSVDRSRNAWMWTAQAMFLGMIAA